MKKARVLDVKDLSVHFRVDTGSMFRHDYHTIRAVDRVSLRVHSGETLGIVGESGCGKSTLARAILGLIRPTGGKVLWLGEDLTRLDAESLRKKRRELQLIFQDPSGSLDPRMTAGQIIAEPLRIFHPSMARVQIRERVQGMMKLVGLLTDQINRYPHEFSGGQCQRIGIARALVLNPRLVVCDEPVSALDVSIQAQIVNLLRDLQKKLQLSLIFIAHDLSIVRHVSDRVLVMYMGRVMEVADRNSIYHRPAHPYTQALIESVPIPDPVRERARQQRMLTSEMPSPINPPSGCVFRTRCPYAIDACAVSEPKLEKDEHGNRVACIRAGEWRQEAEKAAADAEDGPAAETDPQEPGGS